ncbi:MAG: phosphatidylglycerophosphatase A [Kangiellaceae bacterium]|nr:phosphatidylglycerophosphatase A [Kangiellaceae bacterium]MCW8998144.1 phosphatidylglycerophosphatase A [Kangiellaceae bacterium]
MSSESVTKQVLTHPVHFLAFGFGSGLSPKAPGTCGSLIIVPVLFGFSFLSANTFIVATMLVSLSGIYICGRSAELLKTHDHPGIVWDEFAGMFVTFLFIPITWQNLIAGFILFRLFDILKPWPIKWVDKKVSGGLGIMLDDILAGLAACGCLHGLNLLW